MLVSCRNYVSDIVKTPKLVNIGYHPYASLIFNSVWKQIRDLVYWNITVQITHGGHSV